MKRTRRSPEPRSISRATSIGTHHHAALRGAAAGEGGLAAIVDFTFNRARRLQTSTRCGGSINVTGLLLQYGAGVYKRRNGAALSLNNGTAESRSISTSLILVEASV